MRLPILLSALLALSSPFAMGGAKCDCSKACKQECKTGKSKNCKCDHCDCKEGEKCAECHTDRK